MLGRRQLFSFDSTYKELKLSVFTFRNLRQIILLTLPIRNWNEKYIKNANFYLPTFDSTYKELKLGIGKDNGK